MDSSFMAPEKKVNIQVQKITNRGALETIQKERKTGADVFELYPWAYGTSFIEIAEGIIPDRKGQYQSPLYYTTSFHRPSIGIREICLSAQEFIKGLPNQAEYEVLSLFAYIENDKIVLKSLVRSYGKPFSFVNFFKYIHDDLIVDEEEETRVYTGNLLIPEEAKDYEYSDEVIEQHNKEYEKQKDVYFNSTWDTPFLNQLEEYVPSKLPVLSDGKF